VSAEAGWWYLTTLDAIGPLTRDDLGLGVRVTVVFAFPLLFAGIGAYICCFFRRENPFRSLLGFAIAPALLGIAGGLLAPALIVLNSRPRSIFDKSNQNLFHNLRFPLRALVLNSGTGFQLALLGLLLALLCAWLLKTGRASLPLQFDVPSFVADLDASGSANSRQKIFVIYVLTLFGFGGALFSWPLTSVLLRISNNSLFNQPLPSFSSWFNAAQYLAYVLPLFLLAVWTLGSSSGPNFQNRHVFRRLGFSDWYLRCQSPLIGCRTFWLTLSIEWHGRSIGVACLTRPSQIFIGMFPQ